MIATPTRFEYLNSTFKSAHHYPEHWTRDTVNLWLKERVLEYGLDPELPNRFPMNGRGLCMLDKEDFRQRAPDAGDVLYNSLHSLSFTTPPLKSSFAQNISDPGVQQWMHSNEEYPSPAFCTDSIVSPHFVRMQFDCKISEPESEPLNLKVTKPWPPKTNCTVQPPFLDPAYRDMSAVQTEVPDQPSFVSSCFGRFSSTDRSPFRNPVFPVDDGDGLNLTKPFRSSETFLPPLSLSTLDPAPSSSPLRCSEQFDPHFCSALPASSSLLPFARPSSPSCPIGASAVPLGHPGQQSIAAAAPPLTPLRSLVSLSNAMDVDQPTDLNGTSTTSSPLRRQLGMVTALAEPHESFKHEIDQQQIQVTTTSESNSESNHKAILNLSTSDRLLWKFLAELLDRNRTKCITWEDRQQLIFQIMDPNELAELWGEEKCKPGMTYEKLSRALRYYYKMNILEKVPGKRLTYRFLTSPQLIKKGKRGAKPGVPHKRRQCVDLRSSNKTNDNSKAELNKV